ncbi:MAG TPA: ribulose-phosphate 3-epimerase [Candidatus Nanoarchaeia archaeon]|nr:ribulose-phosphate 3-epimerase [Candidatus Nanoarchaeia archaeon]
MNTAINSKINTTRKTIISNKIQSKIWPSVMASDQKELDALLRKLKGTSTTLHLDVSDGKFVPTVYNHFNVRLDPTFHYTAHLMINNPQRWITKHGKKVSLCISQWETIPHPKKFIAWLKKRGDKVAFAIKPETPVSSVAKYLSEIDYILVLTVHPGYYGAPFLKSELQKVREIKKLKPDVLVIVDGGINPETITLAKRAGADYFVSGSYVTKSDHPRKSIKELRKILQG